MADPDLRGTILDGRYRVIEPIASGAMGSVLRGEHVQLGRAVAIKLMHESLPDELASRQRFEREAKLMAKLDHPNCVSVSDFGVHDGKPYLVMDLVRGTSLFALLERERVLAPKRAVELVSQVLSGLAHAHELGIIHRDVKPANVMVSSKAGIGEHVLLLDFGLARNADRAQTTKLTTGIVVGTPNYMAPEQCRGGALDGRTDLYALGVMLFELLTGRKPFVADDPVSVVRKHLHERPPTLADVRPGDYGELEHVVARALAKAPAERYATATEMADALAAAVEGRPEAVRDSASAPARAGFEIATASGWELPPGSQPVARPSSQPIARPSSQPIAPGSQPIAATGPRWSLRTLSPPQRWALGGGGLLVVVILGATIAAHRGDSSPAQRRDAAVAIAADARTNDPVSEVRAELASAYDTGDVEQALDIALRARRTYPDDGSLAFWTGKLYFAKLYWTDGLRQLREAIRLEPTYRVDPELIRIAVRGFGTTPSVDERLEAFLRVDIGEAAIDELDQLARTTQNATVRARAQAEISRLRAR